MRQPFSELFIIALLVTASLASASPVEIVTIEQPLPTFQLELLAAGVPTGASGVHISQPPAHCALEFALPDSQGWWLDPTAAFWSVGNDRLEVSWSGPTPGSSTVLLVAGRARDDYVNGFETGDAPIDPSTFAGAVSIGPAGAIFGARGLFVDVAGGNGFAGVPAPCCNHENGNASGSQVHVVIERPPGGPGTIQWPTDYEPVTMILATDENGAPLAELQVAAFDSNAAIRAVAYGNAQTVTGDWFEVAYDALTKLRFDSYLGGETSTLVLGLDDLVLQMLSGFSTSGRHLTSYRYGAIAGSSSVGFRYRMDDLRIGQAGRTPEWQLALEDAFTNRLAAVPTSAWAEISEAAGDLRTTDSQELEIAITNPAAWAAFLRDSRPLAATGYSVRFEVDTGLLSMTAGDQMHILVGYPDDPVAGNHLQVRIRPAGDAFEIRADAKDNLGGAHNIAWSAVGRGVHLVEVQWRAASGDVADGYVRLFLDGQLAGEATGIANGEQVIKAIRFGALGVDDGTSGNLVFDDFVSWTASPPDPLP